MESLSVITVEMGRRRFCEFESKIRSASFSGKARISTVNPDIVEKA
jgi:hypothetical protein